MEERVQCTGRNHEYTKGHTEYMLSISGGYNEHIESYHDMCEGYHEYTGECLVSRISIQIQGFYPR